MNTETNRKTEKIHKFIARCGIASRRKAEELIQAGRVTVNDKLATIGQRIDPLTDVVKVDGKKIEPKKDYIYIILNKPKGVVTTAEDELGRKTVLDFIKKHIDLSAHRVFTVGRLDKNSVGLVFLTDDGEVAYHLMHPKEKIPKVYIVKVKGHTSKASLRELEKGVVIEGRKTLPCKIEVLKKEKSLTKLRITLFEGKKRQIRKMMKLINHPVVHLERVAIGPLKLGKLKRGSFRILDASEVKELKEFLHLNERG